MEKGYRALRVMDQHLDGRRYFVADRFTIADIALYASTHLAGACDFDLSPFVHIRSWLDRVSREPRFVPMEWDPEQAPAGAQRA